jgi:endonuclease/exonuclease/phosphatase family metal-dependent hydrolase
LIFALLVVFDNFTYDYAYVRDFAPELRFLNNVIPPLLRGFRGMGLAVLLLSVFLGAIPIVQTTRRIPWVGKGSGFGTILSLVILVGFSVGAAYFARPPVISGVRGEDRIRVATYNIHSGYSEFFYYSLEDIARTIQQSGANVVLLQEIEAGRLTSFGVDQPLWLARRLGMDRRFFPTNEGLYGLAVLSDVEIVFDDSYYLTSTTNQTGLQRVQIRPDAGIVNVYNTWLGQLVLSENGTDDSEQQRQLSEIFAILATHYPNGLLSGRTVFGGTFNNTPSSALIARMGQTGLIDPFAGRPIEVSATLQRSGRDRARFDYLWLGNLGSIGALVLPNNISDHRLAVVEVALTR